MGSLFEEKKLNVFGLSEPNLIGKGEVNFEEVRVFKSGVGRKGRQREGVTVLSNDRLWKCVREAMWVNLMIMFRD